MCNIYKLDETQQKNEYMHWKLVCFSQVTIYLRLYSHFHITEEKLEVTMFNFFTISIIYHKYVYCRHHEKQEQTLHCKAMSTNRCVMLMASNHGCQCQQTDVSCSWRQTMVINVNKPMCHAHGVKPWLSMSTNRCVMLMASNHGCQFLFTNVAGYTC